MKYILLSLLVSLSSWSKTETAESIIRKVDDIRNPAESYLMKVEIHDAEEFSSYEVSIQGNDKTFIKTLEPPRDLGRNFLMLSEDMWAFIPNLKRAVRISLSQKLNGQAANGDISRMRWSGDYEATFEDENNPKEWKIFLTAKKKGLTYDKIRVWVEKGNFHPLHAEFLTLNEKPLKKVTYQDYKEMAGKVRPTGILIQDATHESKKSIIKIISMEIKKFPESIFNQNNLR